MCLGKTPFIALIGLFAASPLAAQTILERAARDEIATVADSDPAMAAAIRKARSTLADFLKLTATPRPGTDAFSLKVAVHDRLLATVALSFPARSIIRRAWFTR